jgi:hypothetical protein
MAVRQADLLVAEVMGRRGYPVGDFEQMSRDVSVDHADVVHEYRAAHEISELNDRKQASTEQLRQAMVHYRALFTELLEDGRSSRPGRPRGPSSTTTSARRADHDAHATAPHATPTGTTRATRGDRPHRRRRTRAEPLDTAAPTVERTALRARSTPAGPTACASTGRLGRGREPSSSTTSRATSARA